MIKDHDVKRHTQIAISRVGASKWAKLPDNVKFALISKAFNYGTIYNGASRCSRSGYSNWELFCIIKHIIEMFLQNTTMVLIPGEEVMTDPLLIVAKVIEAG